MQDNEIRSQKIDALRAMADFFEANPQASMAYTIGISYYCDAADAHEVRRGIYGWEKQTTAESDMISYVQDFTPELPNYHKVTYRVVVDKSESQTCKRVQVATRTVPAQEAYEEPVYVWDCDGNTGQVLEDDSETNAQAALAAEIDSDR